MPTVGAVHAVYCPVTDPPVRSSAGTGERPGSRAGDGRAPDGSQVPNRATEVTAAGIARLAGVGRAAVSNWRRRHPDFPQPVGGTESSPTYSRKEVEHWLRTQGKLAEIPLRERVWQLLEGDRDGTTAALARAGELLLGRSRPAGAGALAGPLAALAQELGPAEAFEFLLGRHLDANPRQSTLTPPDTAELMAALAGPARTVLDPACGTGRLLAAAYGPLAAFAGPPPGPPAGPDSDRPPGAHALWDTAPGSGLAPVTPWELPCEAPPGGPGHRTHPDGTPRPAPPETLLGQEQDPDLARLAALRLTLRRGATVHVRAGDSLRADAWGGMTADAVLCHPPFNERHWGHEELAYDPRWEYGLPARTESELAWVQHALAHLAPGGTAVLLMPPAAASRKAGRRIRAALLRRGALRAVIALPPGAAPPNNLALHLWVLRAPSTDGPSNPRLLLVDTSTRHQAEERGRIPWRALRSTVLDLWRVFDQRGVVEEQPGVARARPVIELLDEDVDLAPARHLPPPAGEGGVRVLSEVRRNLNETLRRSLDLALSPPVRSTTAAQGPPSPPRWPVTTVGELARVGALTVRSGSTPPRGATTAGDPGPPTAPRGELPVLTANDIIGGTPPSGSVWLGETTSTAGGTGAAPAPRPPGEPTLTRQGDVVVPVLGQGSIARVVPAEHAGAVLGRHVFLLRCDPQELDPWFLAGFLRGTANTRQASSYASSSGRLDVRRLQLPRLPLVEQRRYGRHFQRLADFEAALRRAGELGEQLVRGTYDGLTDGTLPPD